MSGGAMTRPGLSGLVSVTRLRSDADKNPRGSGKIADLLLPTHFHRTSTALPSHFHAPPNRI